MSEERLVRARALLERAAGRRLVHRGDTLQDPWKALELAGDLPPDPNPLPGDLEEPACLAHKEEHDRPWPDTPLPYLEGKTPREAVRTAGGRRRVADLIRMIEKGEERNRLERGFGYEGGSRTDRWPSKPDSILFYAKDPERDVFSRRAIDRMPYKSR